MNEVIKIIKRRRSIRKFRPDQIKDAELKAILDAAIYAPSGHNEQPWFFSVIQNDSFIDELSSKAKEVMATSQVDWIAKLGKKKRHILYNAPTVIVISGRKGANSPLADCCAAIQNMLLAAESLNIGSLWVGLIAHAFGDGRILVRLQIPEGYEPYYAVCLGYKQEQVNPVAAERNRNVFVYID
ncbi:MAG TPA: nitroreductase family protein [Methylomusa anaerophila]|nr:nitroreductase family protein [Methylomusa anaerophila]HML89319.1 nitroreductase family protein [Methylomusa anaerophila]